ncbi:MAG: ADP-heptose--LPS heptosyltransferase [Spirosoma sp.]|nr:ADP-heptose--LPS heptosyltransferase [Spirosoma sp.]
MIGKSRKYCAPRSVAYPLRALDLVVDTYVGLAGKRQLGPITSPPTVLVLTSGHLGDALILSYTFPLIHQRYPGAQIDVVAGSWCDPIWADNPYVRQVVHVDHPSTNRRASTISQKWRVFGQTARAAIAQIRNEVYDYSVDIRFSSAPMHFLLPFLQVKQANGFGTYGWGGLLDNEFFLPDGEFHNFALISQLFGKLGVETDVRTVVPYFSTGQLTEEQVWNKLGVSVPDGQLVLLFPETGSPERELPSAFWHQLIAQLVGLCPNATYVFIGQTPLTSQLYDAVQQQHATESSHFVSAVGKLSIRDLAVLARQASFAVTLDSLPAHLCVIFCPTVSFFNSGMGLQFFPIGNKPTLVFHNNRGSQDLTLDRPGFVSTYVEQFDEVVIEKALRAVLAASVKTIS